MKNIKLNNKGFMLIEVIIVTVVVATIMTSLYVVFNRVYNAYELKTTYTNIDAIYGLKTLEDLLIDEMKLNNLLNTSVYQEITCNNNFTIKNSCNELWEQYNINKLYLVKLNSKKIPTTRPSGINETFKDYIDYLNNAVTFNTDYIFIVETYEVENEKNTLNRYAYLEIK